MAPPPEQFIPLSSLSAYQVGTLPSLYIIPDFYSPAMEQQLLTNITSAKQSWQQVSGRRLQNHGGIISSKGGLIPAPIPQWLQSVINDVCTRLPGLYGDNKANHVLINSYNPGDGIMPHQDGPLYYPAVAILSLGSPAVIRFTRKREENQDGDEVERIENGGKNGPWSNSDTVASVLVLPRSLLVFKDEAYEDCLHGIDFVAVEQLDNSVVNPEQASPGSKEIMRSGTRVSLTIRRVLKVHSLGVLRR